MFLLDSLLAGGLRFVLDKIAAAADQELNDAAALREQLLAAQMRVELGEMSEEEFSALETAVFARLRELREGRQQGDLRVTGVEISFGGDEPESL